MSFIDFWDHNKILILYLFVINVVTFAAFGIDKWKAVHGKWRIRVFTLIGLSCIGGSAGGLSAMYIFRHKTKKPGFMIGLPVIFLTHTALIYIFIRWTYMIHT